jgi:hypothetical protein
MKLTTHETIATNEYRVTIHGFLNSVIVENANDLCKSSFVLFAGYYIIPNSEFKNSINC